MVATVFFLSVYIILTTAVWPADGFSTLPTAIHPTWRRHMTNAAVMSTTALNAKTKKNKTATKKRSKPPPSAMGFGKNSVKWDGCESLRTWLYEHGANVDGVNVGVVDPVSGLRGVTANRDFKQGDVIFSIPRDACIMDEKRVDESALATALYPTYLEKKRLPACVRVALYLLWLERGPPDQRALWEPVLAVLPTAADFEEEGGPMELWSDEEIEAVECGQLVGEVHARSVSLREHYDQILPRWVENSKLEGGALETTEPPSFSEFQHAVCVVTSRAYGEGEEGGGSSAMLVPGVDLCNHLDPPVHTIHALAPWGDFVVYANEVIKAGSEIYMTYGPLPNRLLLAQFGFLLPEPIAPLISDTAIVRIDSLFAGHETTTNGPGTVQSETIADERWAEGPGSTVLSSLSSARRKPGTNLIARWQDTKTARAAIEALAGPDWDADGEEARRRFHGLLQRELEAFSTTLEEDEAELLERSTSEKATKSPRRELALRFRIQAKRMLLNEMKASTRVFDDDARYRGN